MENHTRKINSSAPVLPTRFTL